MKKRTKILATVGPASDTTEKLIELIEAGVDVFRMNFSHGTHEYHSQILSNIREAMKRTGLVVGILQDISGPKIRVEKLKEDFYLKMGDKITFQKESIVGEQTDVNSYRLSINQSKILDSLKINDLVYLYDGYIRTEVIERHEDFVIAEVKNGGKLSSNKGVNFPNTSIGIDVLTKKDRVDMRWGVENSVDFMAISFVQNASDMITAREIVDSYGGKQQLFAKIEKFDAVENIDSILEVSDGLMVARGDLGIEVPYYEVPPIQKTLIRKANAASKPVITATQMLFSMIEKESATRAEISDVANSVLDGTDAVMLSEESAVGHNPVLAVQTMVNTIKGVEKVYPFNKFSQFLYHDDTDMIDESAVRLAEGVAASGILAITSSGQSAKKIARYRPECPIFAITHDERVLKLLTIVWGVVPAFKVDEAKFENMLGNVVREGIEKNVLDPEKTYMLTAGYPVGVSGTTNLIRILKKDEMEFFKKYGTFCKI